MSSTISPEQWDQRKDEILRLYIDEGWALKPVMRAMRSIDFDPTESQYRTKLKRWKRRKPRNNHHQSADIQSSNSHTPIPQPAESISQCHQPPQELVWKPQDQTCPPGVEGFDPAMLSNQTPYHWPDGFIPAFANEPPAVQAMSPHKGDGEVQREDTFHTEQHYGNTMFDLEEYKARAKRMATDSKMGNPGHSRVQVGQRRRYRSPSQYPGSTYACPDIVHIGSRKLPHATGSLPTTNAATTQAYHPTARNFEERRDAWWPSSLMPYNTPPIPREENLANDFLDI